MEEQISISEHKLKDAVDKLEILHNTMQYYNMDESIDMMAAITGNVSSDEDISSEFKQLSGPSAIHKEFVSLLRKRRYQLWHDAKIDKEDFAIKFYSRLHDKGYSSLQQILTEGKDLFTVYDISMLQIIGTGTEDEVVRGSINDAVFNLYQEAFYDRAEVLFTYSRFHDCNSKLIEDVEAKLAHVLESIFSIDRFTTLYRSISDPYGIKYKLMDEAQRAFLSEQADIDKDVYDRIPSFFKSQIDSSTDSIEFILDPSNETPEKVQNFIKELKARDRFYWHVDTIELARQYSETVANRCNLMTHTNDDNHSFFGMVIDGYASVATSIFENITDYGRQSVKEDIFRSVRNCIKYTVEDSFKKLPYDYYKRRKPIDKDNNASSGFCYITTAVCQYLGKEDDCHELQTLRWFRDNWLKLQPNGDYYIQLYYKTAPEILTAINSDSAKDRIFKELNTTILSAVDHIESQKFDKAFLIYKSMVSNLLDHYKIDG